MVPRPLVLAARNVHWGSNCSLKMSREKPLRCEGALVNDPVEIR